MDAADLLAEHRTRLTAYVRKRLRDSEQADDIVQETFVRVVEQERKQRIEQPLAYAFRVADSILFARARKGVAQTEPLDAELACTLPLPEEVLEYRQRLERFEAKLADLPPLRREVFVKRHLDGKSRAEIAEELGLSLEAVKKHLVRAMIDLAECGDLDGVEGSVSHG
ncbi:RNA polymerase sigma factor [Sphingomonas azotifigens]|uniref:RNA polymerase sigma factor n=1 Tax=Sphingomonas azotifigens TaxID=330920 RepID=UPI001FE819A1|nr:sigma-70 family RNA polymerase sigma factor [Sphingomonas azotifigens]